MCTQLFHICYTFLKLAMSTNRPQKLQLRPQSRKAASSHKGVNLQKWSIIDMRNALVFYFAVRAPGYTGCKYGYKSVADAYHVPRETFRRCLSGPLKGYFGHVAGGQANQQNFVAISQPSILLTPIHLALANNLLTPITAHSHQHHKLQVEPHPQLHVKPHPQLQVEPQLRFLRKGMVSKFFTFCFISLDHM